MCIYVYYYNVYVYIPILVLNIRCIVSRSINKALLIKTTFLSNFFQTCCLATRVLRHYLTELYCIYTNIIIVTKASEIWDGLAWFLNEQIIHNKSTFTYIKRYIYIYVIYKPWPRDVYVQIYTCL